MAAKKTTHAKPATGDKKVKRHHKKHESYAGYVFKVLKQVHPGVGISRRAMSVMTSLVGDTFEKVAAEAGRLCKINHKGTLGSREVGTAVRLVLPGELAKHATSEGAKAVAKITGK